jgi:tetratricopeptide (TPR) repeat protein
MSTREPSNRFIRLSAVALLILLCGGLLALYARTQLTPDSRTASSQAAARGDFQRAAELAAAAAQINPDQHQLWVTAGNYAIQAGDQSGAVPCFEQALALQADLSTLEHLQQIYENLGQPGAAANTFRQVLEQPDLSLDALEWLLSTFWERADYDSAETAVERLAALRPEEARFHYQLGLLRAASEPQAALHPLRQAARLDPALAEAASSLESKITAARRSDEPAFALLEAGRGLAFLGEWDLAGKAFERAVQARPDFAEAWAYLGASRQHTSTDPEAGLEELDRALALEPESVAAQTFLALYWQRHNQPEKALLYIRAAVEREPNNPILQVELGRSLARTGELEAARQAYQQAAAVASYEPAYLRLLSEFCIDLDYAVSETGLPAARQALLLEPQDPQNLVMMARVLTSLNDLLSAERFAQRALQVDAEFAPAHLQLGIVYLLGGDQERGLRSLETARLLAPESPIAEQAARLMQTFTP